MFVIKSLVTPVLATIGGYTIGFIGAVAAIEGIERLSERIAVRRALKNARLNDPCVIDGECIEVK